MSIVAISHNEMSWEGLRNGWYNLLENSSADRLFLDWDWVALWWKHFGRPCEENFCGIAIYDNGALIGAACMAVAQVRRRPAMALRSAYCIGGRLDDGSGMMSEYLGVVAVCGREADVMAAITDELAFNHGCQELVFCWSREALAWHRVLGTRRASRVRLHEPMTSYQADIRRGFAQYLGSIGRSSRRSLYNLRRRLGEYGDIEFQVVDAHQQANALQELNGLHALRWGRPAFSDSVLAFHLELSSMWNDMDRLAISRLQIDGKCVSVLYDIRIGKRQYNLQMGFDPAFSARVSLGLLHLGYSIEQACAAGVETYDLLAGWGKSSDYKRNLSTGSQELQSVQILTTNWPAVVFAAYDAWSPIVRGILGPFRRLTG